MGKILDTNDFILFRPNYSYRTNANTIILKGVEPIIFDTGTPFNPGTAKIKEYLQKQGITPESIKSIVISHAHQDHFKALPEFRKSFSNASVYVHQADANVVYKQFKTQSSWKHALKLKGYSLFVINLFEAIYFFFSPLYFQNITTLNHIDYTIKDGTIIGKDPQIKVIHTPGHTDGHICVLDSKGNFFIADMVPFTPWIEPNKRSLNQILGSVDKIIDILKTKSTRVIRCHGDYRFDNWEINSPEFELEKFEFFKDSIEEMLEKIPGFLKKPRRLEDIAQFINPNYNRYSKVMKLFFVPPAFTWAISYCLKLESEGKIAHKKTPLYTIWSS